MVRKSTICPTLSEMLPSFPTPTFTYTLNIHEGQQTLFSCPSYSLLLHLCCELVSSQVNCCGFAQTSAIAFTAVISSAIRSIKEQRYTLFLSFSLLIGFLAVEALLKPHITNWINSPKPLRHNLSIQKKPAHKKTDSPPAKQAITTKKNLLYQRKKT